MADIIEQCAESGNEVYATFGKVGHLRAAKLSDKAALAFTGAVLAKFKELTAEPTPAMINNALPRDPYNVEPLYRIIFESMTEQMWKDIGI